MVNKVLYMEFDPSIRKYTLSPLVSDPNIYGLGDLVIYSNSKDTPNDVYKIRVHSGERIVYDEIHRVFHPEFNTAPVYELKFSMSQSISPIPIYFYATKVETTLPNDVFAWVLNEEWRSEIVLDILDFHHEYNVLGDTFHDSYGVIPQVEVG